MKTLTTIKTTVLSISLLVLLSCNDENKQEKMEQREQAKVGKVYDEKHQGIEHENRENQFFVSRNDDVKGQGQETGAPSDTATVNTPDAEIAPVNN